nr:uncharacterized protein LOC117276461 [Nicotiana tomentosiformis]
MVADALSRKTKSTGSLEFIPAMERPLAMDVQALAYRLMRLVIFELSRVLACVVSQSSLFERIKGRVCVPNVDGLRELIFRRLIVHGILFIQVKYEHQKLGQSMQKSYADRKARDMAFMVGENVLLRALPMKGVMRFGKIGKLSPLYIGPFEVLERVDEVGYRLSLPPRFSGVHLMFHVSMLWKYYEDQSHVLDFSSI